MRKIFLITTFFNCLAINILAMPNVGQRPTSQQNGLNKTAAGCDNTTAVIDLDINNVRARLMTGGDMWWDRPSSSAAYEVPKSSNKNSLFAGSIWIGGIDHTTNELKVAAQTYRQTGNDYWSGPLDNAAGITAQTCANWDRFWKINASDINKFKGLTLGVTDPAQIESIIQNNEDKIAQVIKEWPAKGNSEVLTAGGAPMQLPNREFAPFVDVDNDGVYNWHKGDYPSILGDQYIWWVFNDKGNAKTETQSEAIGLEIHAAAFAFSTNDCLNEATFYNYKVFNYSTSRLDSTYMSTWSDADLGYAFDDFVGCDTARGLGILYNGDGYDEGAQGYGFEIPMVGVDYFKGPKYFDGTKMVELKMTAFTYYNNDWTVTGNPQKKSDFYGFMTGSWKDGSLFTTACNAYGAGTQTKFIFTGDPCKGGWSEVSCNNTPYDRRFIHSSGPFPLIPGAEPNDITIGAVWVPNVGGGKSACFTKIQACDDKAQDLFDNQFKLPFGPQAPHVTVSSFDKKLVFDINNLLSSNNYEEGYGTDLSQAKYREVSKRAISNGSIDTLYKFEGYIVYQLKDGLVALSDIRAKDGSINTDKARIAFQCDIKNGIKTIINYEIDPSVSGSQYIPKLMITGADTGIAHSFQLTQDLFATGTSKNLVNYKTYYYVAIAYGYNNFKDFDATKPDSSQLIQYVESRTDGREQPISIIEAMPTAANTNIYVQTYADYGTGIQLKKIEGIGNGGNDIDLTEESEMEALQAPNYKSLTPVYKAGKTPVFLQVVNPNKIQPGDYEIWVKADSSYANPTTDTSRGAYAPLTTWFINKVGTQDTIFSERNILNFNEKYLRKYDIQTGLPEIDWGLSVNLKQAIRPGDNPTSLDNGLITSDVVFEDINNKWLTGVADEDGKSYQNWIRAGSEFSNEFMDNDNKCSTIDFDNTLTQNNGAYIGNLDQMNTFEKVLNGTFSPYYFASNINNEACGFGLMFGSNSNDRKLNSIYSVQSIDIVFTSDKSLWSRCPVIEMTETQGIASPASEGGAFKYNLRKHQGWNKEFDEQGNPVYSTNPADSGMSYFPGYAINVETGERLNIYFGEASFDKGNNGRDLIWNPTSNFTSFGTNVWGGKHIIYVAKTKYDGGQQFASAIKKNTNSPQDLDMRTAYRTLMWVGVPLLNSGFQLLNVKDGIIPTTTRLRIRVSRPYSQHVPDSTNIGSLRNNAWPLYTFNTNDLAPAKLGESKNDYTSDKKALLKRIQAVPNPYYAYSQYEQTRVDTRVKIINLPAKATIKIFTIDGTLIRTINKNDATTNYIDWDIKNDKGIPIASGMYLIHVNIPNVGETVLKWFGAMRPVDLISF
ncbi:MAG TPA: hypothetical protein PKA54_07350 [Chitinophagaceae bacterium]|nr:hypothetical protein [Chitinophagaceae bacterium]